jgi:Protein of unknown function (DUF3105)
VAKSSKKDKDRRAVIEQMRLEQKRAEKKRTYAVVAVCVLVALVIIGLGAYPLLKQKKLASGDLASLGADAKAAGCQPITTKAATGNADHKPIGTKIFYPDAPPAFGPHYPVTAGFARKFYTVQDRPKVEYLVHNLEHGYTLLWYDKTIADESSAFDTVKGIASKFEGTKSNLRDKFVAAPWTAADGAAFPKGTHVALTHWSMGGTNGNKKGQLGVWQYCGKPSGAVVSSFMKSYPYSDSPEPTLF